MRRSATSCSACESFFSYEESTKYGKAGYGMCVSKTAEPSSQGDSVHPFKVKPADIIMCQQFKKRMNDDKNEARANGSGKEEGEEEGNLGDLERDLQEQIP